MVCKKYLEQNNYEHYEISNFALKSQNTLQLQGGIEEHIEKNFLKLNYRALHNTNYWEQKEYIGIGAGASSF